MGRTAIGQPSPPIPAGAAAPGPPPTAPHPLSRTVIGQAPPNPAPPAVAQAATAAPAAAPHSLARTAIGQAPPLNAPLAAQPHPITAPAATAPAAPPPSTGARNLPMGTMLGVALPGIAPTHDAPPAPARSPLGGAAAHGAVPNAPLPAVDAPAANLRGAAVHTRAGAHPAPVFASDAEQHRSRSPGPHGSLPPSSMLDGRAGESVPPRSLRIPIAMLACVALGGVAAAGWFLFRPGRLPQISAELEGDATAPELVVHCAKCADGTNVEIDPQKHARFTAGRAVIPLDPSSLRVGDQQVSATLTQPSTKPVRVTLQTHVPFLVRPSLAPIARGESAIEMAFELSSDVATVRVNGQESLPTGGAATSLVAIPPPTDELRGFERAVDYVVTFRSGGSVSGALKVAVPYAPLRLGLPGRRAIVASKEQGDAPAVEVTGKTASFATVRLGAAPDSPIVIADKEGIFRGLAPLPKGTAAPSTANLEVKAYGPKLAPRVATVTVHREHSVEEGLKKMRAEAMIPFATLAMAPDTHVGAVVTVTFVVAQRGEEDGRPIAVGDVRCAARGDERSCPVVRVLLPAGEAAASLKKGDAVEVLGVIVRGVPIVKGRSTAVEVDASAVSRVSP